MLWTHEKIPFCFHHLWELLDVSFKVLRLCPGWWATESSEDSISISALCQAERPRTFCRMPVTRLPRGQPLYIGLFVAMSSGKKEVSKAISSWNLKIRDGEPEIDIVLRAQYQGKPFTDDQTRWVIICFWILIADQNLDPFSCTTLFEKDVFPFCSIWLCNLKFNQSVGSFVVTLCIYLLSLWIAFAFTFWFILFVDLWVLFQRCICETNDFPVLALELRKKCVAQGGCLQINGK